MSKPHCNCATSYPNSKGFCERCGGYYGPITQLATATKNLEHYQACESVYRKERDALKQEREECKAAFEISKQQMVLGLEGKVALAAQLAEARENNLYMSTLNHDAATRIGRLERALAKAKEFVLLYTDDCIEKERNARIEEIEELERGE